MTLSAREQFNFSRTRFGCQHANAISTNNCAVISSEIFNQMLWAECCCCWRCIHSSTQTHARTHPPKAHFLIWTLFFALSFAFDFDVNGWKLEATTPKMKRTNKSIRYVHRAREKRQRFYKTTCLPKWTNDAQQSSLLLPLYLVRIWCVYSAGGQKWFAQYLNQIKIVCHAKLVQTQRTISNMHTIYSAVATKRNVLALFPILPSHFQLLIFLKLATICQDEFISSIEQSQPTQNHRATTKMKMNATKEIWFRYRLSSVNAVCACAWSLTYLCEPRLLAYGCLLYNEVNSITIAQRSKWDNKHTITLFCYVQCGLQSTTHLATNNPNAQLQIAIN